MANLFILIVSPCALAKKWLFWLCEGSALWEGARPNVPLAGWHKIVFKKCGWEKNKKHRVGNECRLTRCPFVISFLCFWSPVKMVYFFLFLVVCLLLSGRPLHLLPTVCRLPQWGISEHFTVNQAQMLIEALHLN